MNRDALGSANIQDTDGVHHVIMLHQLVQIEQVSTARVGNLPGEAIDPPVSILRLTSGSFRARGTPQEIANRLQTGATWF